MRNGKRRFTPTALTLPALTEADPTPRKMREAWGTLAEILEINQAAVSKIENRVDMYVSTLRRFVEAMGGQLVISAHFPDGTIRISQFERIADEKKAEEAEEKMAPA